MVLFALHVPERTEGKGVPTEGACQCPLVLLLRWLGANSLRGCNAWARCFAYSLHVVAIWCRLLCARRQRGQASTRLGLHRGPTAAVYGRAPGLCVYCSISGLPGFALLPLAPVSTSLQGGGWEGHWGAMVGCSWVARSAPLRLDGTYCTSPGKPASLHVSSRHKRDTCTRGGSLVGAFAETRLRRLCVHGILILSLQP